MRERRERAVLILDRLHAQHPDATIELNWSTPLELLVATILSAQCTDVRVNQVTAGLFRRFRRPEDYLAVPLEEQVARIEQSLVPLLEATQRWGAQRRRRG